MVVSLAWSADSRYLVAGSREACVVFYRVSELENGVRVEPLKTFRTNVNPYNFGISIDPFMQFIVNQDGDEYYPALRVFNNRSENFQAPIFKHS